MLADADMLNLLTWILSGVFILCLLAVAAAEWLPKVRSRTRIRQRKQRQPSAHSVRKKHAKGGKT